MVNKMNETKDKKNNLKIMQIRLEKDLWVFLKKSCVVNETSIMGIIRNLLNEYRVKEEKRMDIKEY